MKRLFVAAVAIVALAGCVSPKYVTSDVTRFHTLPSAPSGQSFVIATIDPEQGQSLAYHQYADMVTAKLVSMGLKPFAGPTEGADFVVTLRYDVRGPTPDVETRYSNWSFGLGYGGWGRHAGWAGSAAWGGPYDNYTDTRQMFVREVELNIYKGATYNSPQKMRVFEGHALSAGQNGQLEPVMPYILDAMFKDFPGRSGETQTVSIQVPEEVAKAQPPQKSGRASY
jgi:hypothetical protein